MESLPSGAVRKLGRYALYEELASGGMATIHFGRLLGVVGFSKTVAIKRLHPQLARDPEFVSMFLDEARLAARIRHPNVVSTLDVVATEGELFLVMEYVQGESLRYLELRAAEQGALIPPNIVVTIMVGMLYGLHAAHEATNEQGEALGIVHRDVSPQNVLVGVDGITRVFDFGVAKASGRAQTTREGQLKGKLAYMSPEQLMGWSIDRSSDIFAASIVLWEALTGKRLFKGDSEGEVVKKVLDAEAVAPSKLVPDLPLQLDEIVLRGLARKPADRFATAREMGRALEKALPMAPTSEVGEFVEKMAAKSLAHRAARMVEIESSSAPQPRGADAPGKTTGSMSSSVSGASFSTPPKESIAPTSPNISVGDFATAASPGVRKRNARMRSIVAGAIGVAAALLLVALGASLRTGAEPKSAGAATASTAHLAAQPPLEGPVTPPVEVPAVASATASAAPAVTAQPTAASATADSHPAATAAKTAAAAAPHPAPTSAPNQAATQAKTAHHAPASCDPPFTVDANGYRHYKLECAQ
jgi:serine/threonine-protein kinase